MSPFSLTKVCRSGPQEPQKHVLVCWVERVSCIIIDNIQAGCCCCDLLCAQGLIKHGETEVVEEIDLNNQHEVFITESVIKYKHSHWLLQSP